MQDLGSTSRSRRSTLLRSYTDPAPGSAEAAADLVHLLTGASAAPIAFFCVLEEGDRLRLEACLGMDASRWPRSSPLLEQTLRETRLLEIEDAGADPRFKKTAQGLRFFAAWPLRSADGLVLGVLGVADVVPGRLEPGQRDAVARLARAAEQQLELRHAQRALTHAQSRIESLESIARIGSWRLDLPDRALSCSAEARRLLGVDEESVSVETLAERVHAEDRAQFLRALEAALGGVESLDLVHRAVRPNGSERVIHARAEAEPAPDGSVSALHGSFHDVTLHRRMAWEVTAIFDLARDLLCVVDYEGRFQRVSASWRELLGYAPSQLLGSHFLDYVHPDDAAASVELWNRALQGEAVHRFENRYRAASGEYRTLVWSSVTVPDRQLCFASARDVSEERRAIERLRTSEERFRLAVNAARDVIWDWDARAGTTWWSESFLTLFGAEGGLPDDRRTWLARVHPEDRARVERGLDEAIARRAEFWEDQYRFRRASGVYAYVRDRSYAVYDAAGAPVRMTGSMSDVTELREQAALLDQSSDLVFVLDASGRTIYANAAAGEALQRVPGELCGLPAEQLAVFEPAQLAQARLEVARDGTCHCELRTESGRAQRVYDARFRRIDSFRGHAPACLVALTDVTERRKFEAQFLHAQRLESIGTLAGGIAHDLNNVLAPILVAAELLELDDGDADDRRMFAATIGDCARRGAELVRQVLSLSRSDSGDSVEVRPERQVEEVARILRETIPHSIRVETECAPDASTVRGDPAQIRQALLNLAVNARDAMEDGGVLTLSVANVMVDAHYAGMIPGAHPGRHVMVAVTDTGPGIPEHVKARMFEPFFTTKEIGKGTGLGLSTVHAIVKRLGGFVNVYSEIGRGSSFKVYLPAAQQDAAPAPAVEEPPQGHGETVLFIDDEASIRTISAQTLRVFGYQVLLASDGAEGVATFAKRQGEIRVVLTDMMMPVMDGRAVIRALKSLDPQVRIIAISGLGSNGAGLKNLGPEVKGFLAKPYSAERMLRTIREVIDA